VVGAELLASAVAIACVQVGVGTRRIAEELDYGAEAECAGVAADSLDQGVGIAIKIREEVADD
jgi:hypothetical protein